ncbi:hypothetical protein SAMN06265365_113141 [Tistlia consotensis]|uniref:Uncharacterized protein n=1 Tax=Tistlia consotensis USBA 355 TaxID=560819 RepID=A0A1Y6C3R3_9PROT|nr:hypothetical protein [Tistlia consotensis]SMF40250.1 hypothetical protein SAMN05428998_1144 [Tistlia consotensis USBA 355]SNR75180.1 hypothetical protein SAMN06265365_113141 [Tistlia consotensis]
MADPKREVLERIWLAQAEKLAALLETTPADQLQAALLNVARQFLSDNGINRASLSVPDIAEALSGITDLPFTDPEGAADCTEPEFR